MIVVTGGGGFIGSNLVAELNSLGMVDILIIDSFGNGDKWQNIAKRQFQDIVKPSQSLDLLKNYSSKITAIFHLGANSSTTASDADEVISLNLKSSMEYWGFCSEFKIPLYYASSAATYGDGRFGFDDEIDSRLLRPLNLYGWSKNSFDIWAMRQSDRGYSPPRWAGFKFFNVYGPNEYHKGVMMSLVAKNYGRIISGNIVQLFKSQHRAYKDGQQLRDFIYVKDCCEIMTWFFNGNGKCGLYNVGSGQARSFLDLISAMGDASNSNPKVEFVDLPPELASKYQYFTQANMCKLREQGYEKPLTSIENGVKEYIANYLSQDDIYR